MNKLLVISLMAVICCYFSPSLFAEEGEYAADFLSTEVGARAVGMGGAYVSVANDATATYWNPAGLTKINSNAFSAMYADVFEALDGEFLVSGLVKYNFVNYVHNFRGIGVLGFSWIRLGIDDIPRTTFEDVNRNGVLGDFRDANGNGVKDEGEMYIDRPVEAESFSNADDAILISYARQLRDRLALGGNFKVLRQTAFNNRAIGWGFDAGVLFNPIDGIYLGAILQDATGTRITWDTKSNPTFVRSPNLKLGASLHIPIPIVGKLTFSADIDTGRANLSKKDDSKIKPHYGAEYWLLNLIALRAGLEEGEITAGAGFRVPMGNATITADYAFVSHEELGGSQRISISGQF